MLNLSIIVALNIICLFLDNIKKVNAVCNIIIKGCVGMVYYKRENNVDMIIIFAVSANEYSTAASFNPRDPRK